MALRESFAGQAWSAWPAALRTRQPETLAAWRQKLAGNCRLHTYQQFVFAGQWDNLKSYANRNGVRIFGDIPIFVASDSADVWANQQLFQLDELGRATAVAGVPPDYFSATGQRWGNPLYRWERLAEEDFHWWLRRFDHQLHYSDLIRIDHFRGFQACWSIPADETTAISGRWEVVPGRALFEKLRQERRNLPIIVEDLGYITPEVEKLRDDFGFPGMKILQFAFDGSPDNPYLPENHTVNSVVYTGTHDNNTTLGWFLDAGLDEGVRNLVHRYTGADGRMISRDLLRLAFASVAGLAICPLQDVLGFGEDCRMNTPGTSQGNWRWRCAPRFLTGETAGWLREETVFYNRLGDLS